jgi:hypothetical protein
MFELFYYIKDYQSNPNCCKCSSKETYRLYAVDVATQSTSVKKLDSELKTIGDLALRNSERMSADEKDALYAKHNSYKYEESKKELPSGMSRIKKSKKPKWPGSASKTKRKMNKK